MEIAENITLGICILWAFWQLLSLRNDTINGEVVFPPAVPGLILFIISIIVVVAFHLSPFHLIWLAVVTFFLGIAAYTLTPVQALSIALLTLFLKVDDEDEQHVEISLVSEKKVEQNKPSKKGKGFGS